MQSREAPLTKRERAELEGIVSWPIYAFRAVLFLIVVGGLGACGWRLQSMLSVNGVWWLLPASGLAVFLFIRSRLWTGGSALRDLVRRDLAGNTVVIHTVRVVDAIAVEEGKDEGPTFFVAAESGETLAFVGQYLSRHAALGFPTRELEIRETPNARRFLGVTRRGDRVTPSLVRPPLSAAAVRELGLSGREWQILPLDFERIRRII